MRMTLEQIQLLSRVSRRWWKIQSRLTVALLTCSSMAGLKSLRSASLPTRQAIKVMAQTVKTEMKMRTCSATSRSNRSRIQCLDAKNLSLKPCKTSFKINTNRCKCLAIRYNPNKLIYLIKQYHSTLSMTHQRQIPRKTSSKIARTTFKTTKGTHLPKIHTSMVSSNYSKTTSSIARETSHITKISKRMR